MEATVAFLEGNLNLALFATAQERRNAGGNTCSANAQDREKGGHLGNWDRDPANVIDLGADIGATVAGGFRCEIGLTQLIGAGHDGEVADELRSIDRCLTGVGPGQVQQGGIVGRVDQARSQPGQGRGEGPASRLKVRGGREITEIEDGEVNVMV